MKFSEDYKRMTNFSLRRINYKENISDSLNDVRTFSKFGRNLMNERYNFNFITEKTSKERNNISETYFSYSRF